MEKGLKETRMGVEEQRVHKNMNGGDGEHSYAKSSFFQEKGISCSKLIREEAIASLYSSTLSTSLVIADMGCSSGPNTLSVLSEIIMIVEKLCRQLSRSSPEYKVFLNDLPENDFNSLFKSLESFKEKLPDEIKSKIGHCYFFGAPGSFHGRVFPDRSLHFIHSSYTLHWLSKVPEDIENNKGNIYLNKTSPSNVLKAYYKQFQNDFSIFLKSRAKELVEGGRMVLTFVGRRSEDPCNDTTCYLKGLLANALKDMVQKGTIKEDKVDTFNVPNYYPSQNEVKLEVFNEGSFTINQMEVFELNLNPLDDHNDFDYESKMSQSLHNGYNLMRCMRAVFEPLIISHFGEAIVEEVFSRYQEILVDQIMSNVKIMSYNFTISLTRKA